MRFLYVFALMFLSIFGLVMLLKILYHALLDSATEKRDVYIKDGENIGEFLENARKSPFIGRVFVITRRSGEELKPLLEKYDNVSFIEIGSALI